TMNLHRKRTIGYTVIITLGLFGWVACINKTPVKVRGYQPVYLAADSAEIITSLPGRSIRNGGKIYAYKNRLFQMETGSGIHVIDANNPSQPTKLGFIAVPGCSELSIQNDVLYTDNFRDLVGIDISQFPDIELRSRLNQVFPGANQEFPPYTGIQFECVDPAKGYVVNWIETELTDPKCQR
ncbi:MAG: hypothetical protein JNM44_09905, partial [Chitinophagaceae bacterium]|nr:hypothetical protein [Chitinophagaceae bacterium]